MVSGNVVPILDISPKQIYQIFLQQKQIAPTAKQKLSNKYSNIDIDWEKVYTLAFQCTLDTKIREFHYKLLNCMNSLYKRETEFNMVCWNGQTALSVKKQRNLSSIYSSPAGYLLTFGNMSCPG